MIGIKKKTRISLPEVAKRLNYPGGADSLRIYMQCNPHSEYGTALPPEKPGGRWKYILYAEDFDFPA